jgi:hypothetical protein
MANRAHLHIFHSFLRVNTSEQKGFGNTMENSWRESHLIRRAELVHLYTVIVQLETESLRSSIVRKSAENDHWDAHIFLGITLSCLQDLDNMITNGYF